jgi:hypothetical protein
MKRFGPKFPTKERFESISAIVDGKSAKECFIRFKEICASLKKKD